MVNLSGGKMDDNLKAEFEDITRTILDNQVKDNPVTVVDAANSTLDF